MPRYFFDIRDGGSFTDEIGQDIPDLDAVRTEAMRALPEIARHEISKGGDHQSFAVLVRDEGGQPIYSATLSFAGEWLTDHRAVG